MNKLIIKFIKYYKSNLTEFTNKCKYTPTCSSYALECFQRFNFFKASFLSLKRILRCNQCFRGKYDPVPLSFEEKHYEAVIELLLYPKKNNCDVK